MVRVPAHGCVVEGRRLLRVEVASVRAGRVRRAAEIAAVEVQDVLVPDRVRGVDVHVDPVLPVGVRHGRVIAEGLDDVSDRLGLRPVAVRVARRAVPAGRRAVHPIELYEDVLVLRVGSLPGIVGAVGAVLVDAVREVPFAGIVEVSIEVGVDAEALPVVVEPVSIKAPIRRMATASLKSRSPKSSSSSHSSL